MGIAEKIVGLRDMTVQYLDQLDVAGEGVVKITKGKYTNRKAYLDEMGRYLLYIASGNGPISEGQASLYNLSQGPFDNYSASDLDKMAKDIKEPNGGKSFILEGYKQTDILEQLVFPFDFMGRVMVAFSEENPVSMERYEKYLGELKAACGVEE